MEQRTLFDREPVDVPLAARVRPRDLSEFFGQTHLLGPGMVLRQLIEEDRVSSMIFWGPPGGASASGRCSLSMRSTGSTAPSRTRSCRLWKRAPSC